MLIIGESINGTIQKVGQAILDRNEAFFGNWRRSNTKEGLIPWISMQEWPAEMR